MKSMKCQTSLCSRCHHYTPEGRRGGVCGLLNAPVKGSWKACSLAMPVFFESVPMSETLEVLLRPVEVELHMDGEKQALEALYSS